MLFFFHTHCRDVFIPNVDATTLRTFVATASLQFPGLQYVRIREQLWHRYIFESCKSFTQSVGSRKLTLAVCLGRQPASDVWVLAKDLQVTGEGMAIPEDEYEYFWYPQYRSLASFSSYPCFLSFTIYSASSLSIYIHVYFLCWPFDLGEVYISNIKPARVICCIQHSLLVCICLPLALSYPWIQAQVRIEKLLIDMMSHQISVIR